MQSTLPLLRRWTFAALVVAVAWREFRSDVGRVWLWKSLGLLTLACVCWVFDYNRVWCWPLSPFQGHALWHVLTAVAAWYLWRHLSQPKRLARAAAL